MEKPHETLDNNTSAQIPPNDNNNKLPDVVKGTTPKEKDPVSEDSGDKQPVIIHVHRSDLSESPKKTPSRWSKAKSWCQKHKKILAITTLVMVIAIVFGVVFWRRGAPKVISAPSKADTKAKEADRQRFIDKMSQL